MDYPMLLETRFKIQSPLRCEGAGGMVLAKERDRSGLERLVAVRWFPAEVAGADAVARLQQLPVHASLPRVSSSGADGGCAWVAIDFPEGKMLSAHLEHGPVEPQRLMQAGAELAGALAQLHQHQVLHGELSLDSVMWVADRAVLVDVAALLANRATDRRGESRTLAALTRTVDFLAPEAARGAPVDASADVYALGALLCTMGCGRRASPSSALLRLHQLTLGQLRPEVPPGLDQPMRELLAQMVTSDPAQRPTAGEVEARFKAALHPSPLALVDEVARTSPPLPAELPAPRTLPETEAVALSAAAPVEMPSWEAPPGRLETTGPFAPPPKSPEPAPSAAAKEVDPFEALLNSTWVSAVGMTPGHDPTLQDVVPLQAIPTRVDVKRAMEKKSADQLFENLPSNIQLSPLLLEKGGSSPAANKRPSGPKRVAGAAELAATVEIPSVEARPTAPVVRHGRPSPAPAAPSVMQRGFALGAPRAPVKLVSWLAGTNARLGAVIGCAAVSLLMVLTLLGEYQTRLQDISAALKKPDYAAEAREKQKRLEEAPPPRAPNASELRQATEANDDF